MAKWSCSIHFSRGAPLNQNYGNVHCHVVPRAVRAPYSRSVIVLQAACAATFCLCHAISRIQQMLASFLAAATRAICLLDRLRNRV